MRQKAFARSIAKKETLYKQTALDKSATTISKQAQCTALYATALHTALYATALK